MGNFLRLLPILTIQKDYAYTFKAMKCKPPLIVTSLNWSFRVDENWSIARRRASEGIVRTAMVVEVDPSGRQFSHLVQTVKDVHIENCLSICPVKTFDKAVLHRAAGFDEIELDAV